MNISFMSFSVCDNVKVLKILDEYVDLSYKELLFIFSSWQKVIPNLGYSRHWKVASKLPFYLPTKNGKIDFEFIESFVAELEAQYVDELESQYVDELEAYLTITDFKNYKLTGKEKKLLDNYQNLNFKEFNISDLFEINPTKTYRLNKTKLYSSEGFTPIITNTSINNGVNGYSKLDPTEKGNMITFSDTTTSQSIFYQPNDFIGFSHVQGMYPKMFADFWKENTLLYKLTSFKKSADVMEFSYGNKFNRDRAKKLKVWLPIKNNEIDFSCMDTFITAVKKIVIQDLVKQTNNKINLTKKVINNNKSL